MRLWISIFALLLVLSRARGEFLRVQGRDLYYGADKVFLSGANYAWNSYGHDFGNGNYQINGPILEQWIRDIANAGGNSLRVWIHVEGMDTPRFVNGYVYGLDNTGDLINDMSRFLDVAAQYNVLVIPVLWNGALMREQNLIDLLWDDAKLESYLQNALRPLVRALRDKPALGAWEVMNEPEGSVLIEANLNPCYDTLLIGRFGAGWTGANIPMERFLRFINRQNAAIRQEDSKAVITLGSWSEHSQNSAFPDSFNHYSDHCLIGAGGQPDGILDVYQMHTYSWEGYFGTNSPFKVHADDYQLNKPLIIGEFSSDCAEGQGVNVLWDKGYNQGYDGLWSWQYNAGGHCSDTKAHQNQGMTHIRYNTHNGRIPINIQ